MRYSRRMIREAEIKELNPRELALRFKTTADQIADYLFPEAMELADELSGRNPPFSDNEVAETIVEYNEGFFRDLSEEIQMLVANRLSRKIEAKNANVRI